MPWLIAAALLHSAIVVEKREALKSWTILLAIMAFGFSLLGAFIVRSGVLTSVHAFANDPERGMLILIILAVFLGGALTLFAFRAGAMESKGVFSTVSRESALILNNILLSVSCFVVFIGTIWPLVAEMLFDRTLSVGPPFFDAAFTPFMVALAIVLPLGSLLAWKRGNLVRASKSLVGCLVLAVSLAALAYAVQSGNSAMGPIGVALGVWVVAGAVLDLWLRSGRGGLMDRLRRISLLPRADWGKATAHIGMGVTVFGIAAMLAWQQEDIRVAEIGDRWQVGQFEFQLDDVNQLQGPNYLTTMADISIWRGNNEVGTLQPEKRFYPVANMPTTEAAIRNGIIRDIYVVVGDPQENGGWAVRVYLKPFANWIWGGAILMALGGCFSLSDRRLRVGAASAKRTPQAVPAE
jgi:cytochrome c-type biogenesis protein CcmF